MYSNIRAVDPLGMYSTAYNMCLTPAGLVEVLTRLATIGYKYYASDVSDRDHLIHMLRLMNKNIPGSSSDGRSSSNGGISGGGAGIISSTGGAEGGG